MPKIWLKNLLNTIRLCLKNKNIETKIQEVDAEISKNYDSDRDENDFEQLKNANGLWMRGSYRKSHVRIKFENTYTG